MDFETAHGLSVADAERIAGREARMSVEDAEAVAGAGRVARAKRRALSVADVQTALKVRRLIDGWADLTAADRDTYAAVDAALAEHGI